MVRKLLMLSLLNRDFRAIRASLSWTKFSLTSYLMVSRLLRQGILPKTVLDVGANVGQFAVAASKLFPGVKVHSFEPSPSSFKKLCENVSNLPNVTAYPIALGDSEREVMLHINEYPQSSSILPLTQAHREAFPKAKVISRLPVQSKTLAKILSKIKLRPPVLLKLDVQGYEAQVIRGARERMKSFKYVVLEASFKPMYVGETVFADLIPLLGSHGFTFQCPVGWLTDSKTDEILQMDALFIRDI